MEVRYVELYLTVSKGMHNLCWSRKLIINRSLTPYVGHESALLHAASLLDLRGCWVKAFKCFSLNECVSECINPAVKILTETPVYGWLSIEGGLKSLARTASRTYSMIREEFEEFIKSGLRVKPWREIHAGLAYAPGIREASGIPVGVEEGSLYSCVLVGPATTAQGVADSVIGESLKAYVRKGLIPLSPAVGNELVSALAPAGELSKLLNLTPITKPCRSEVCKVVSNYFREGRGEGLINYFMKNFRYR